MITNNDITTLLDPRLREYIAQHIEDDPKQVALSLPEHGALIATQIKYLQRARLKLPSYYTTLCILPPLSFEQSSSEEAASVKRYSGDTCLDLTCGLGVDAFYMSKRFRQVIAVERDPGLCDVARINFNLLGVRNIRVINSSAEIFLERLLGEIKTSQGGYPGPIDLIYIDPARRDDRGKKVWLFEDCTPNVKILMPQLLALAPKVVIKASPLFDVDEAFRVFGESISVEVVSVRGECKEVLIEVSRQASEPEVHHSSQLATTANNKNENPVHENPQGGLIRLTTVGRSSLCFNRISKTWIDTETTDAAPEMSAARQGFDEEGPDTNGSIQMVGWTSKPHYLLIPDVTLYKARLIKAYAHRCGYVAPSARGYGFSDRVPNNFFGRAYPIGNIFPYQPKILKQYFKQAGITRCNLMKKENPYSADAIAKALGIRQGGSKCAAFTRIGKRLYTFLLGEEIHLPISVS